MRNTIRDTASEGVTKGDCWRLQEQWT